MNTSRRVLVPLCLGALYVIWGSTYLAQRVALEGMSPLQMAGVRFVLAGAVLYAIARLRGAPAPAAREVRAAAISGVPMLVFGMGTAAFALRRVPSGLGALVFGAVPLLVSVFDAFFGGAPRRREAIGLALGLAGVLTVSLRGGLRADPVGAALLVLAAASYALGCVLTRRLPIPGGTLGSAVQMLVGGAVLAVASLGLGEPMPRPPSGSLLALAYLIGPGTLVGYSALGYLLRAARPAVATSYAFVNPVLALALGAAVGGERVGASDLGALALVLGAVACVARAGPAPAACAEG
jgi:drug/metabolite transporter (DMT)-like permease